MASHNTFCGYVKVPGRKLVDHEIRLDFNCHVKADPERSVIDGFSLRMFAFSEKSHSEDPEIAVTMTGEQWLDLIQSMRDEFEVAQKMRKTLEGPL